jgi:hypothetical protein
MLICSRWPQIPEGDWYCPECSAAFVDGVTNCSDPDQHPGSQRPLQLGRDRLYRAYMFIARRVVV